VIVSDWVTEAGFRAIVYRIPGRHYCGYVGLPENHPLYGIEYSTPTNSIAPAQEGDEIGKRGIMTLITLSLDENGFSRPDIVFDVHGSLTYSGKGRYPVDDGNNLWWFGFDTAHCDDDNPSIQNESYVFAECESLALQIRERTLPSI